MLTLLIVDDHRGFRAIARTALGRAFRIIGEAADAASGLALARELDPDVVLLDVQLPDADGFAVAAELAASGTRARVVLTSTLERAALAPLLRSCSAVGFVEKHQLSATILLSLLPSA